MHSTPGKFGVEKKRLESLMTKLFSDDFRWFGKAFMVALLGTLGDAYQPCDNEHRHQNVGQE